MKFKFSILFLLFMICGMHSFSQTPNYEQVIQAFFKTYKDDPGKAYVDLFGDNKWMANKKGEIETVKTKLKELIDDIGAYYGYELITEKSVGANFVLKTYLIKYERQPMRFTFVFYKPNDKWQIQNFSYDLNLLEELEEAAKVYRLPANF